MEVNVSVLPPAESATGALAQIAGTLAAHGLALRGGFNFGEAEDAPARAVLLVGNEGAAYWQHFERWWSDQPPAIQNPLDTWSRMVIGMAADKAGARVLMPNDRPFAPFQQWAMRAEGLRQSPLGLLIHPRYGLWHAYRGALLFDHELTLPPPEELIHPCDACVGKPCLNSCPVGACTDDGFAYQACLAHVRGARGAICRGQGCLARNACPVGTTYRYPAKVQAFHQKAFARL